ncbi:MAG: bifunctional nuclease family protein [Planctomycetota bacterium]
MDEPAGEGLQWVDLALRRVVLREGQNQQWIYLAERASSDAGPPRGFPIVIGTQEAVEIQRVLQGERSERPLTHQLALGVVEALGGRLIGVEINGLRNNTYFARLVLQKPDGSAVRVDARPSDALALGLRAGAKISIPDDLLEQLRADES